MRYALGEAEWKTIQPILPCKPRGVPRVDDRRVLNGIFWVLRSGAPWRDLPDNYGPYTTCYDQFVRWRRAGVRDTIMDSLAAAHDAAVQMIDTSVVRVHQHGACIAKSGEQDIGRSRGGLTTKLHAVVDANGLSVRLGLACGQTHDNRLCSALLQRFPQNARLLADRGHDADQGVRRGGRCMGKHPAQTQQEGADLLQSLPLSRPQSDRAVLQQDQAMSPRGNPVRQARSRLPWRSSSSPASVCGNGFVSPRPKGRITLPLNDSRSTAHPQSRSDQPPYHATRRLRCRCGEALDGGRGKAAP